MQLVYYIVMEFEWDEQKNQANIMKHGISFDRAKTIFGGDVLARIDDRYDYGEAREVSLGLLDGVLVLYVVHTERDGKIRLISARPANQQERRQYDEFTQRRKDH